MYAAPFPIDATEIDYRRLCELRDILGTGRGLPRVPSPRKFLDDITVSATNNTIRDFIPTFDYYGSEKSALHYKHRRVINISIPDVTNEVRGDDIRKLGRERDAILRRYVPGWNEPRALIAPCVKKFTDPIITWDFEDVCGPLAYPQSTATRWNDYAVGKPCVTDGVGRLYTKRERAIFEKVYNKRVAA